MTSDRDTKDCVTRLVCCVFFLVCLDTRLQIGSETILQRGMLYQGRDIACILHEVDERRKRKECG